jgi:DNA primase
MGEYQNGENLAKVLKYYGYPVEMQEVQKIVCPFHEDANPSMLINLAEGSWYCFGCQLAGDAFQFVKNMERKYHGSTSDLEMLLDYQRILKSDEVSDIKITQAIKKAKLPRKELYDQAYDYYHGLKKIDWGTDKQEETITCLSYMQERGFAVDTLNKVGAKITYNNSYPIIFPMMDNGKFRGWVCRTTDENIAKKRKYLYNEGFSRATTLVGNYKDEEVIFVVEGYMDRLKFIQNGVDNVVAILGWKMSQQQREKIYNSKIKVVVSALDNDVCGRKGTEYLKTIFPKVYRWTYLKGIKDPGDMSKELFAKMYKKTLERMS